jgi:hypothetical protein
MVKKKRKKNIEPRIEEIVPTLVMLWRRIHKKEGGGSDALRTREFRSVVAALRLRLNKEKRYGLGKQPAVTENDILGSKLIYDWIVRYQQGIALCKELPGEDIGSVLDISGDFAPMAAAALRCGATDVTHVENDERKLSFAIEICGRMELPLSVEQKKPLNYLKGTRNKYDLIMVGYCLEELFPETENGWREQQKAFIKLLKHRLTDRGVVLFVGGSNGIENKRIIQVREDAIATGNYIYAPCIWQGKCPLENKAECYAQYEMEKNFMIQEIHRATQMRMNSLKMTYCMMMKEAPYQWPKGACRVVMPIREGTDGKRRCKVCGEDGKIRDMYLATEELPETSRAFEFLKRGDLITVEEAGNHGKNLTIVDETVVRHIKKRDL